MHSKNQFNAQMQFKLHTLKDVTQNLINTIKQCAIYLNTQHKETAKAKIINQANTSFEFVNQFNNQIKSPNIDNSIKNQIKNIRTLIDPVLQYYSQDIFITQILTKYKSGFQNKQMSWIGFNLKQKVTQEQKIGFLGEIVQGTAKARMYQEELQKDYDQQEKEGKLKIGNYRQGNKFINNNKPL